MAQILSEFVPPGAAGRVSLTIGTHATQCTARQIETERARVIATRQEGLKVHLRKRSEISWENPFRAFRADAGRFSPQDSVITSRRVRNDDTRGIGITSRPVEILNCCILFRLSPVSRCRKSVTYTQN